MNTQKPFLTRRTFLRAGATLMGTWTLSPKLLADDQNSSANGGSQGALTAADLPTGSAPAPVLLPHFPDRLHAFIWRNWPLAPIDRMAQAVNCTPADLLSIARAMGLSDPPRITAAQLRRSALTIIRRNWHLLPYDQLLALLDWTPEQMAFTLREDDFLYIKLGNLKPRCARLAYHPSDSATRAREAAMAQTVRQYFPDGLGQREPLFDFVNQLAQEPLTGQRGNRSITANATPTDSSTATSTGSSPRILNPRYCYSYFALYGDPLLDPQADPYPNGYLAQLAAIGVNGVWLQAVLSKLAPFPWEPGRSADYQKRLANLRALTQRARQHGIGVYLYLNEPRALPLAFYASRPQMRGVTEGDFAALCTSNTEVQAYLVETVRCLCESVPDLAGLFTISGSENLTNCWSHGGGAGCARCRERAPADVIAELHDLFLKGIHKAGARTQLIAWDWGWGDDWAEAVIAKLPTEVAFMSVSEWGIPIRRGGIETAIGEYSLSTIGPGARALRRWKVAHERGLKTLAKVQIGNTWELSAVPYIPALENVARDAQNVRKAPVDGVMLGWTLGGYPSPNLELFCAMAQSPKDQPASPEELMTAVANRRFGPAMAPAVVQAWRQMSAAFSEFPFHGGLVYTAPMQFGPSNLLWGEPTGYRATMIGFPYDDLDSWRAVYPAEVFIEQFDKVATGFEQAVAELAQTFLANASNLADAQKQAVRAELTVAEAVAIHFRSTTNQARFCRLRRSLKTAKTMEAARPILTQLEKILRDEIELAKELQGLQARDSRLGFEASNQYYYVGVDLAEKVLNCQDLLDRWLPAQRPR